MTGIFWVLTGLAVIVWLVLRSKRPMKTTLLAAKTANSPERLASADLPRQPYPQPRVSKPQVTPRWVAPGADCTVQQIQIPGGMVYVGSAPPPTGYGIDRKTAHVIDPAAKVDAKNPDFAGQTMAYWPSYIAISPQARAGYLHWLAGGRRNPNIGIGHVFLFLYGLEYRLFVDGALNDAPAILSEVEALIGVYAGQASFRQYATRFVDAVRLLLGNVSDNPPRILPAWSYELPLSLQMGLGRHISNGRLSGAWLFAWYVAHPETQLRTPATRCFEEFRQLFLIRFARTYPQGFAVRVPAKKLKFSYKPASGMPHISIESRGTPVPDPTALTAPLKVAVALGTECTAALDSYSRFVGRYPAKRTTLAAALLLPPELRDEANPMLNALRAKLEALAPTGVQETTVGALLAELGFDATSGKKPSTTDLTQLSLGLQSLSYGMEPDLRFGGKIAGVATSVLLFRATSGAQIDPARPAYAAARLLVEIAAVAATIDAENVWHGLKSVADEIESLSELTTAERLRLHAYLASFRRSTPNPRQVLTKLSALAEDQRQRIARVAVGALLADRRAGPDEVAFAEKLYKALALPAQQLYSDIQVASGNAAPAEALPRVASAAPAPRGIPIPPPPVATTRTRGVPPPVPERGFTLDPQSLAQRRRASESLRELLDRTSDDDAVPTISPAAVPKQQPIAMQAPLVPAVPVDTTALARKRQETDAVRTLLANVFADAENDMTSPLDSDPQEELVDHTASVPPRYMGLDNDHAGLVDLIIERRGTIPRSDLEAEIARRGMFVEGALETINDWAFGRFDEPLIEEGDLCIVPEHLLLKLLETAEAA